ncbi:ABC transporter ATP-binding protein [Verticiella sediminum]|uniref:ABC transporter ATP-binding protein n=1 Tax=Verticiella sediminum TaxID=1247510 RepID=A0A556A907_9BURK|nr:ABC transporter ATP-binding protein [Verticiella sediminum]TSH89374.1 ABC transporter ATP-binding protein [Verticiella sediminum]
MTNRQPSAPPARAGDAGRPLLQVRALNAWYGDAHILFDLGFEVARGEVLALTGRNGAGKSTTLKSLIGLVARMRGDVAFDGVPIAGLPAHRIARLGLGYVPEDRRVFSELTVLENLETGRQPARAGLPAWTVERLFDMFPNLAAMPRRRGEHMSGGEQQMLSLARTLMGNPRLVLLDEPSEGVAPLIVEQMAQAVSDMKRQGLSVLLSEQNERFVARVADRALRLEQGRIVAA